MKIDSVYTILYSAEEEKIFLGIQAQALLKSLVEIASGVRFTRLFLLHKWT